MKRILLFSTLATIAVLASVYASSQGIPPLPAQTAFAVAVVAPANGGRVNGKVWFAQTENGVLVSGEISGLVPGSAHGFHIHEFGDITSGVGMSLGGHFNPMKMLHGLPGAAQMHSGDLGNITANETGIAIIDALFEGVSIAGPNSILGRGIVVHEKADDGGQPTGNAGGRIAFGVIGLAKEMGK